MPRVRRRGGIKRRGPESWLVSFFIGVDENGKRRDFCRTVRGSRKDAELFLQDRLREFDHGVLLNKKSQTVNEYFDEWLRTCSRIRTSTRTSDGDESIFNRYFRNTIGSKKLEDLQPLQIQRVHTSLLERGLSPQTVRHAHAVIRKCLNQAVKWRILPHNPALLVELPKVRRIERRVLNVEEARRFVSSCDKNPLGLIFEFALLTGMRPEEYLAVQWGDISVERSTAAVRRALVRHKGNWEFREPKTSRSRRTIVLPNSLVRKLVIHKQKQSFRMAKAANLWEANDLVFCGEFGQPLHVPNLTYRYFRPILKHANLPHLRLYDLRHSHASLLLAAEENPKVVSERLGHSTIVLTLDTYSHVLPTMQKRATEKLESMIFG